MAESQKAIDWSKQQKRIIEERLQDYYELVNARANLADRMLTALNEQKEQIDTAFRKLCCENPDWNSEQNEIVSHLIRDIAIQGEIVFDPDIFYTGIAKCTSGHKFKSKQSISNMDRLVEKFNVRSVEDFFELLKGQPIISDDDGPIDLEAFCWKDYFNQEGCYDLLSFLYSPSSLSTFLYTKPSFTYRGKTVDKLSVGQRGTFYVCMKLATEPFGCPLVFDQPEDDLDNEFIMNDLVPLLRRIKKYRQVIVVTHNANIVVNGDAEQVIVATNDNEVISYQCGALEDGDIDEGRGIRALVCRILEGGREAFETREKKYGFL